MSVVFYCHCLAQTQCLLVQCPESVTDVHKYMPQTLDGTLSLPFVGDGVPPVCICNNVKEMIKGKF